ncbi:MAG: CoB--CoM heterodisulfide reductase iron-sulfur subunit B family protein [Anaerolineae bacterium]
MADLMRFAYYPGCTLLSSAKEYDQSVRLVFAHLGIELIELEDWSCCGAVHADVHNPEAATLLPARNLALAEAQGFDRIIAPCSGCYKNLRQASKRVSGDKAVRRRVNEGLRDGLELTGDVEVLHPLYVLIHEYGLSRLKPFVANPLKGWRVASYYGCMLTRPKDEFDSPERPRGLDDLVKILGAETVAYPMKAKCCGGAMAISHSEVTARLTGKILVSAKEAEADVVTLACPMCHTALDAYQTKAARAMHESLDLPILYFTQLMGLAFGLDPSKLGFERHMVSPRLQLTRLGF